MLIQRRKPDLSPRDAAPAWDAVSPHPAGEAARGDDDLMSLDVTIRTDRRRMPFLPFEETRTRERSSAVNAVDPLDGERIEPRPDDPGTADREREARAIALDRAIRQFTHLNCPPDD